MDGNHFDGIIRAAMHSRRTLLGGALAAIAGATGRADSPARKRRKRCKSPRVKCGKKCLRAGSCCKVADCGVCQTCTGKRCVVAPGGTACGVGGECNGTACIREGAFGCTAARDFCAGEEVTACPASQTPEAACFVGDGNPLCAVGGCFIAATDEECEAQLGPGAKLIPCATCTLLSPPPGWAACAIPVAR
ncbi:MAG: hypothetical protein R2853_18695 [Thermomicrobiales bacterium]